jgi:hypothetical protein
MDDMWSISSAVLLESLSLVNTGTQSRSLLKELIFPVQPDLMNNNHDPPKSYSSVEDLFGTGSRRSE